MPGITLDHSGLPVPHPGSDILRGAAEVLCGEPVTIPEDDEDDDEDLTGAET